MGEVIIKEIKKNLLSSVYIVKIGNKRYIKKIIPKDFIYEFYKQKYLAKRCEKIKIPKIYSITAKENTNYVSCLMEYLKISKKTLNLREILKALSLFHKETRKLNKYFFEIYNFERFYIDFLLSKKYLPKELKKMNKGQLKNLLNEVFNSDYSIVHGDFHKNQVFRYKKGYGIIDFISSFYGPSILDYAYLFRNNNKVNKILFDYINLDNKKSYEEKLILFFKSLIVIYIFDIAWFINRRKYEKKTFSKNIKKASKHISYNLTRI